MVPSIQNESGIYVKELGLWDQMLTPKLHVGLQQIPS